ncbi:MAG: hypothetical protein ACTSUY_12665 [Alphaproteobacteria bacterium]
MHKIGIGRFRFSLPDSVQGRSVLGFALIMGGLLGFLPFVGFWMLPLGILVLAVDFPALRKLKRRIVVRWGRFWKRPG